MPLKSVKVNENWALPIKITNTPDNFSLCSYISWTWISGLVGCSQGSSHFCHDTRITVSSHPLSVCWAAMSRSASHFLSQPLALGRHLAQSYLLVGGWCSTVWAAAPAIPRNVRLSVHPLGCNQLTARWTMPAHITKHSMEITLQ